MPTRSVLALALCVSLANNAAACTFCVGVRDAQPLRQHLARAAVVVHGTLQNPRYDPATFAGTTELHVRQVLKTDSPPAPSQVVVLPRYLPAENGVTADVIVFATRGAALEPLHSVPATPAVLDYVKGLASLADNDTPARLAYFFRHLASPDATVAADAFLEFARTPDSDILRSTDRFDAATLRRLIADPLTPAERLGVYAFVLGACGGPADAEFLDGMLNPRPLPERTATALGGTLAGLTLLSPRAGWDRTRSYLADAKRPFSERLSALGTVRFFQQTRAAESKAEILRCHAALLDHGDLADQAVEDLRRWGWWELTADVFAQHGKPTHGAPIVKRAIVRYALTCPTDEAKRFTAALRAADPKLVAAVEETLSLYDVPGLK